MGNAFALPCQDKPQHLLSPGRSMNRPAQDLISPRQELRQHRASRTFRGAEQLRARKRGLRQAHEPTGFLDAVAAAFLPPPLVVRRGDNLAGAAIGERHRGREPDLV